MALPILDNHIHLEPVKGKHIEWIREFERLGGTHVIVSHLPYDHVRVSKPDDFRTAFDVTIDIVRRVNEQTGVRAYATVGPYPAELLEIEKSIGLAEAKRVMLRGMEIAAEYVREGKAVAIGEVGRPHFPVSSEVWHYSNDILKHGMMLAKEEGCAIVLHTESATHKSMLEMAEMADSVGLSRNRVVKHYSPPLVLPEENHGIMPSVLAGRDAVKEALRKGSRFMMETDFLDDPRRPGAVLAIGTVPKRTKKMIETGLMSEEQAHAIHADNPRATYGSAFE